MIYIQYIPHYVILINGKSTVWQWRLGLTNTLIRNDNNNQIYGVDSCCCGKITTLAVSKFY